MQVQSYRKDIGDCKALLAEHGVLEGVPKLALATPDTGGRAHAIASALSMKQERSFGGHNAM